MVNRRVRRIVEQANLINNTRIKKLDWYATIGEYSYGMPIFLHMETPNATCTIGKFCSIGDNVVIYTGQGSGHNYNWVSTYPFEIYEIICGERPKVNHILEKDYTYIEQVPSTKKKHQVTIGNDVWIGDNVTILEGVTVGDGAVLGNSTVIANDVSPYAIMIGNPARILKYRFTSEQIKSLLEIKWWNWTIEKIMKYLPLIQSTNIDLFIQKAQSK
jgi:acetyltransferase-like isoleucine patch superfamily enzyme